MLKRSINKAGNNLKDLQMVPLFKRPKVLKQWKDYRKKKNFVCGLARTET